MSSKKHDREALNASRSFRVAPEVSSGMISKYLEALDCPRALTVDLLFRNNEHDQLAKLAFNPLDYEKVEELRGAYAATKFLSKFKDFDNLGYELDAVANEKFEKFELFCKHTNSRFRALELDPKFRGQVVRLHQAVGRKIHRILGGFNLEEFVESAYWGPGATTLQKARDASATNKFQCEIGITRDLYSLFPSDLLRQFYPAWIDHISGVGFPDFQTGNKVITVPKDATENRTIAIEPGINLWFQLAVGEMIKRRLLRRGVDLRYQMDHPKGGKTNQQLAHQASRDCLNATIDFSSASDSISTGIIRELFLNVTLPGHEEAVLPTWYSVMDSCRSHYGLQGGSLRKWEKFSSMGNGFTFPLESLIFYSVASCCVEDVHHLTGHKPEGDVSVYGDDVIFPISCLETFSLMCDFYGFTMNMKKSHFSSQFRESCGGHFYRGADVKPVYLKEHLSDVLSVYKFANNVRRLAHRSYFKIGCDERLRSLFDSLISLVPKALRFRIPEGFGDGGFISNWDESVPASARTIWSKSRREEIYVGLEGWWVRHLTVTGKTRESEGIGLLLDRLWSASVQERRNTVPLKGRTRQRISRSLVQRWYDLGAWI